MPAMPTCAVLFDFDGVLADTEPLHCAAFAAVAGAAGLPFSRRDYYDRFLGLPDRACLAALHAAAGRPCSERELDALLARKRAEFARLAQDAALYDGVAATLRRLHAVFILAVASGAWRDEIEPILVRAQVRSLFAAIIGAEDVRAGKPAPDPFLRALEAINRRHGTHLRPADCVVVEDAPLGIAAARAAGMACIAVTTHHDRTALAGADAFVADLNQLQPEDLMGQEGSAHGSRD
jgi:HAD superfamily hydrolase (TIGR01509 family)